MVLASELQISRDHFKFLTGIDRVVGIVKHEHCSSQLVRTCQEKHTKYQQIKLMSDAVLFSRGHGRVSSMSSLVFFKKTDNYTLISALCF